MWQKVGRETGQRDLLTSYTTDIECRYWSHRHVQTHHLVFPHQATSWTQKHSSGSLCWGGREKEQSISSIQEAGLTMIYRFCSLSLHSLPFVRRLLLPFILRWVYCLVLIHQTSTTTPPPISPPHTTCSTPALSPSIVCLSIDVKQDEISLRVVAYGCPGWHHVHKMAEWPCRPQKRGEG